MCGGRLSCFEGNRWGGKGSRATRLSEGSVQRCLSTGFIALVAEVVDIQQFPMTSFSLPQKEVGRTMTDRLRFITHQGKQILLIDLSNCPAAEVEKIFRAVPDLVTARPRGSVLILSDFTGASFDEEAMRVIKETALFDKHFVKKSAWTGAETISKVFFEELTKFSRRSFSVFKTREAALAWLVKD